MQQKRPPTADEMQREYEQGVEMWKKEQGWNPTPFRNAPDEATIAVSMNYVDGGNLEAARGARLPCRLAACPASRSPASR